MKTILHIVNKPSLRCHSVSELHSLTHSDDAVLFFEDGVYNALNTATNQAVLSLVGGRQYVLLADIEARGFGENDLLPNISAVDYQRFVELSLDYHLIRSW